MTISGEVRTQPRSQALPSCGGKSLGTRLVRTSPQNLAMADRESNPAVYMGGSVCN
jgi:hypothetical protein